MNTQLNEETVDGKQQTETESPSHAVQQSPQQSSVCRYLLSICLFLAIFLAGFSADLLTKNWAFQTLGMPGMHKFDTEPELKGVYWIWQDVFGFQTSLNSGALFGFLGGQTTILVTFSLTFLFGIAVYFLLWAWRSWLFTVVLGMIMAGICGNLYDRLGWHGLVYPEGYPLEIAGQPIYAVRDWILCMIGTFPWPNFNIADSLLVCSVILLLLFGFKEEKLEGLP